MFELMPFNRNSTRAIFDEFDRRMDNMFNSMVQPFKEGELSNMEVNIREKDNQYILEAALPGLKKEDINLEIIDNNLIISIKNDKKYEEKDDSYIRREISYVNYRRSFDISDVDVEEIKAKLKNGILKVKLPKLKDSNKNRRLIDIE